MRNNQEQESWTMSLNKALLEILVCPQCKGELLLEDDESGLRCEACRLLYAIRDDIPIMLVEEAQPLDS
jgi:uncharacterized protein YbaR (Trm112 family)